MSKKKLSPNFTSSKDKRTNGLGAVCQKKSAIIEALLTGKKPFVDPVTGKMRNL